MHPQGSGKAVNIKRRGYSLSKERIVEAAVEILDEGGADGLTFRSLATRLATGPGALYWHIHSGDDLLVAACDAIIARTVEACEASAAEGMEPQEAIRRLSLATFDAMDAHPWVGSALTRAAGQLPVVRIVEGLGRQIKALGVPEEEHWMTTSALLSFILGVGGRNAANGRIARVEGLDRAEFLEATSAAWSQLDAELYPFVRSMAAPLRTHDDRMDFLAGIDLILQGIASARNR
ncbi:TetR/AcrR family transcriptional regulator [Acidipila sp. EB88]|uniref:TetR/AcrR family transcriptional regulator n=1 Tax=Acidipila sp. EB88 TaxID=2305226 RepID=UPI000F5DEFE7|nr:TetR/AcrR family transcriptional regulator [Acidipila sp. EB88]RRA49373.1 TetR/AcrR family transcriptional regulator [Acidipila sp. EB88]